MAASISLNADDLGCWIKSCRGEIPPPLVGASLTFYQPDKTSSASSSSSPKIFLFGGRLVDERKMMNHLYMLDTNTFVWTLIVGNGEGEETKSPTPRYFHSIEVWRDNLVLFGGMGYSTFVDSSPTPTLVGLSDLYFFHIPSSTWRLPNPSPTSSAAFAPIQRYAHISAVTANRLVIVGGQDVKADYVQDIGVFDLQREEWIASQGMGGERVEERGMYRSACVAGEKGRTAEKEEGETKQDIMLYSNYNFTDVRRVLEVLRPDGPAASESFTLTDRSEEMRGQGIKGSGPQGLRFPSGARLGNWLLFGGIYLASSVQEYCLWALDLKKLVWQPVEIGGASCLKTGSWNRGILDPISSSYLIFGSKRTNMLEDYNKRATNFSHIVSVDLESFGIYRQPSTSGLDQRAKISYSEFEDEATTDFEMICEDGRRLPCSRRVLEERWPWFAVERTKYNNLASQPESASFPAPPRSSSSTQSLPRARVRNSQIHLQEPYPVALALLQYFYTYALDTPVQNAPPVLSSLLVMSQQYDLPHLQKLVLHRMHVALGPDSAEGIAEVASICQCESLCIRAWRMLGSGRIAGATGALAAVRMSRGGSGSGMGGAGGSGRNMSHDSGFESSNGLGARGGSGRGSGSGGSRMTSGQPMSVYGLNESRPRSGSQHDPLPRRGSEPPATIRRGSTPPLPSATESSTSSSFCSQTRQRTFSAGSSIESLSPSTSPAQTTLANPGPGFLQGRDRAYSLGRTALVPSPLSMSSTPASIEISRVPSFPRRMSTSTSGTTADMARSPDRYTTDSSHSLVPYTPNEQESFPFPNPQEKTISSALQAIDGNYSQASFLSRTTTASTESSSGIDTGSEWPVYSKRDSLALPDSGDPTLGFPSPASESGSNTTSSTLEPVRRGSFAISKVFSRKKRSDREDTGLGSPAFAAASSKNRGGAAGSGSARSAGASGPEVSNISRAFGWKHQFKDESPNPPSSSLPPKPSPTYSAGGSQHVNGLFDAPSSDRPDLKRRGSSDPPSIHTISPPPTIRTRPSSADSDDTLSTLASPPTPFGMTPRSTTSSTSSSSNKTSHNSSSASPFHLLPNRQPSFSYPTRPPLLNRVSMTTLTPAASVLSSVESSGSSSRNSSSNSSSQGSTGKKTPPTVYMYGRGGAGRVAAPKPEKTAAEKIAEKEEKKVNKEEKKRAAVFAKNSSNPNRYPPGMVLVGRSGGLALPEKREGATGLV